MELRSFEEWKAETAARLLLLPDYGRVGTFVFEDQRQYLASKLQTVSLNNLSHFLIDLFRFCEFWKIRHEDLFPTIDEITAWFREEVAE